jgi:hypothetical protein
VTACKIRGGDFLQGGAEQVYFVDNWFAVRETKANALEEM